MIIEHAAPAPLVAAKAAMLRSPYVTVRRDETLMQAIARHQRETGYTGGVSVKFERARAA